MECIVRGCAMGRCTTAFATPGTMLPDMVLGDCKRRECNAAGMPVQVDDDGDHPADMNECTTGTCVAGVPAQTFDTVGSMCTVGGSQCDGMGTCVECLTGSDCTSQVCSPSGACAMPTCTDMVRNGTETGVDCGGPSCPACPAPIVPRLLATGGQTSCAVGSQSRLYCWGSNNEGQLGNSGATGGSSNVPTPVTSTGVLANKAIKYISVGGNRVCALDTEGKAYCWGHGTEGQLGNGGTMNSNQPVAVDMTGVLANKQLVKITSGEFAVCAIDSDGKLYCWGRGDNGVLGNGDTMMRTRPTEVSTSGVLAGKRIADVAVGNGAACAIDDAGAGYCWGSNFAGWYFGNGSTMSSNTPVNALNAGSLAGKQLRSIAQASGGGCGVDTTGAVHCWGGDYGHKQGLPAGNTAPQVLATGTLAGKMIRSVSIGLSDTACAIDGNAQVHCWGFGYGGMLGDGDTSNHSGGPLMPAGDLVGKTIEYVGTGNSTGATCAMNAMKQVACWGNNNVGQVGNGNNTNQGTPLNITVP